jgi:hypothetical protein
LGFLGHDAFKPAFLGFPEELGAGLFAMLAEGKQRMTGQDASKPLLALRSGNGRKSSPAQNIRSKMQ